MVGGSSGSKQFLIRAILCASLGQGCIQDPPHPPVVPQPEDPQYIIWDADSYAGDGVVRVFWDATPLYEPFSPLPISYPRTVHVEVSTQGVSVGYRLVWSSTTIGPDSVDVPDLGNGVRHWIRILSYDAADHLVGASRVLETIPGPAMAPVAVIPAFQRHFLWRDLAWSPRGDKLIFAKAPGCVRENLYCYDVATAEVTPVTDFGADEQRLSHAGWSPDGSRLAFDYTGMSTNYYLDYRIWILPVLADQPQSVSSGRFDGHPAWVTNESLVFIRYTDSPRAPEIQRLVLDTEPRITPLTEDGRIWKQDLAVSPDGTTIVFSGIVFEDDSTPARVLYTLATRGGTSTTLTAPGWWDDVHPAWYPDGRKIFFASARSGHFEIWSLDLQSEQVRQITRSQRRGEERYDPAPGPDGHYLAVTAFRGSASSTVEIVDILSSAH